MTNCMKSKSKSISVLIPDGESSFLQIVVNCLSLVKNIKIFVISSNKSDFMKYSFFVEEYIFFTDSSDEEWPNRINHEVEKNNIDIIIPIFQNGFKRIIKHQKLLKNKDKLCVLPALSDFNTANDKGLLYYHMKANSIPCPNSQVVKQNKLPNFSEIEYPVIVKPVENLGDGRGIQLFQDGEGLKNYYNCSKPAGKTIIQEFIRGYDIGCNVLCLNGDILTYTIQKGNLFSNKKFSAQIGLDIVEEDLIIDATRKLMKSLNWSGIANIDLMFDEKDSKFKILEINPRFWMTTEASALAGINFPYLYCLTSLKIEFENPKVKFISFLTLHGLLKKIKNNPLFVFNINYIMNNTAFRFVLKDPIANFYKLICYRLLKYCKNYFKDSNQNKRVK